MSSIEVAYSLVTVVAKVLDVNVVVAAVAGYLWSKIFVCVTERERETKTYLSFSP